MSPTVRGQQSRPMSVPVTWRGPLPDLSVHRQLPTRDGYTQVPADLVFSSLPDLAVVVWAALRLAHDDQPHVFNYQDLAETLGMTALSARALQGRLTPAIAALAAQGWLTRTRGANNRYTYAAVRPGNVSKRYAQLRRCDLALLRTKPLREAEMVSPTQLVDFCRWQLECGQRGWTAEHVVDLAKRWNLSERQFRNRRARLVACKLSLIVITARSGHADLVWLGELHDPHWQVRTELDTSQSLSVVEQAETGSHRLTTPATIGVSGDRIDAQTPARSGVSPRQHVVSRPRQLPVSPYKEHLSDSSLTADLTDLGGASATPLTSATRETATTAPEAAPRHEITPAESAAHQSAGRLLSAQPYLASAPPHFRAAMLKRMTRALRAGLDARHIARALQRVVTYAARDSHCELVRLALQQAWADQRGGTCPECAGDVNDEASHSFSCSTRLAHSGLVMEDPDLIRATIAASLETVRAKRAYASAAPASPRKLTPVDPLEPFLQQSDLDATQLDWTEASDEELLMCLTTALARSVAVVCPVERLGAIQRVWASWRPRVPPARRDVLDLAALRLRQLVDQHTRQRQQEARVS